MNYYVVTVMLRAVDAQDAGNRIHAGEAGGPMYLLEARLLGLQDVELLARRIETSY